jgi:hypothetical protein
VSYPLGWSLTTRIGVRRERWPGGYDLRCAPLVPVGARVEPDQPVMRVEHVERPRLLPGVPRLSLPVSVGRALPGAQSGALRERGSTITAGLRGTIIAITRRGSVVIEGLAAIVAGTVGAGRQVAGPITIWQAPGSAESQPYIPPGAILVVPGPLNLVMLRRALYSGIAGVVASSVSSSDLETFLRTDLIDLLTCAHPELLLSTLPPLTILLTEGLGTVGMPVRTINLLNKYQGVTALLSGATSLSAQIYPELVIPLSEAEMKERVSTPGPERELKPGALVRVCSGNYEGAVGKIDYLFSHQQLFPSGIRARAARVQLEDGSLLIVPLPVLERIG